MEIGDDVSGTDWKSDAREFGRFVKKGGWYTAYLAARHVVEGTGNGRPPKETAEHSAVSVREFAREAGLSDKTVTAYLKTWDRAADAGLVQARSTFVGTDHNVAMPDDDVEAWTDWHSATVNAGRNISDPGRRTALIEQANADGVGASKVLDVASNRKAVIAAVKADPELAKAIARDPGASVAVSRERNIYADERGVRDPAELERERERKRLAENGPGLVEILDWSMIADQAVEAARKFITPDDGPSPYRDNARIQIEAANTKFRSAVQHVEDVMNGAVDTRIPDDLSGMLA